MRCPPALLYGHYLAHRRSTACLSPLAVQMLLVIAAVALERQGGVRAEGVDAACDGGRLWRVRQPGARSCCMRA